MPSVPSDPARWDRISIFHKVSKELATEFCSGLVTANFTSVIAVKRETLPPHVTEKI